MAVIRVHKNVPYPPLSYIASNIPTGERKCCKAPPQNKHPYIRIQKPRHDCCTTNQQKVHRRSHPHRLDPTTHTQFPLFDSTTFLPPTPQPTSNERDRAHDRRRRNPQSRP